jgi:hypothetical protein
MWAPLSSSHQGAETLQWIYAAAEAVAMRQSQTSLLWFEMKEAAN